MGMIKVLNLIIMISITIIIMTVTHFWWKFVCVWCNLTMQPAPKEKHVNPKVEPLPPVDMTCRITSA